MPRATLSGGSGDSGDGSVRSNLAFIAVSGDDLTKSYARFFTLSYVSQKYASPDFLMIPYAIQYLLMNSLSD